MRAFFVVFAVLASVTLGSLPGCSTDRRPSVPDAGELIVYVHVGLEGLAGKTVDVLDTGVSTVTDSEGIARFVLAPGAYTIRVREITGPGPGPGYVDIKVTIVPGRTAEIEVEDCPACAGV